MSKNVKFASGKIKKVTLSPLWRLKLKGRMNGRNGPGVCDEYIFTLLKREMAFENLEVINAEKALSAMRKQAAGIMVSNSEKASSSSKIVIDEEENSVQAIRANRANRATLSANKRAINSGVLTLAEIHETIIFTETVLEERIEKLRSETRRACHAYVSGVKAGKLKDYVIPFEDFDNRAIEIYRERHKELDVKIHDTVNKSEKG